MHQVRKAQSTSIATSKLDLIDPVSITQQGKVIAFARLRGSATTAVYYKVRQELSDAESSTEEWQGWKELSLTEPDSMPTRDGEPAPTVPPLLRISGMSLITVPPAAATVRPANAAFQVVADNNYVFLFRQSVDGTLYVNRFRLVENTVVEEEGARNTDQTTKIVFELVTPWEVRYRRSGKKDVPAGPKDTLNVRNMDGKGFIEPTRELTSVQKVSDGRFSVVLAPTGDVVTGRWHIFVVESNGSLLTAYSFAQSAGGVIDYDKDPTPPFTITPTLLNDQQQTVPATFSAGVAARIFFDREESGSVTAEETAKVLKRGARMMLTAPATVGMALPQLLFVYDFGILPNGTIASFSGTAGSPVIDGTFTGTEFTAKRPPGNSVSYPVPANAVQVVGDQTVAAVALGQANAVATPDLLDSGDGLVHCYFAGAGNSGSARFLVAQYSPLITRFSVTHNWVAGSQTGSLAVVAERAGSSMNGMTVTVSQAGGGATELTDLADFAVDYGAESGIDAEQWNGVPRDLAVFQAVLNGEALPDAGAPEVQSGQRPFYDYTGTRNIARLPLGSAQSPTGHIQLVDRRGDLELKTATLADVTSGKGTLTLVFGDEGPTLTFANILVNSNDMTGILRGTAGNSTYGYVPGASDTRILGISTTGGAVLIGAPPASLPAEATVAIGPATQHPQAQCKLTLNLGSGNPIVVDNLSRNVGDFVTSLKQDAGFSAVISIVSADAVGGTVADQQPAPIADLRVVSVLMNVVPVMNGDDAVAVAATASKLNRHTGQTRRLTAATVVALSLPTDGAPALVQDGAGTPSNAALNGAWMWYPEPKALKFSGSNAASVGVSTDAATILKPARFLSVEAWARPTTSVVSRILAYNDGTATTPGGVVPSYFFGTLGRPAITFGASNSTSPFRGSWIRVDANPIFVPQTAFTYECWIKPASPAGPSSALGVVFSAQLDNLPDAPTVQLGINQNMQLVFGYRDTSENPQSVTAPAAQQADQWIEVAVTGAKDTTSGKWTVILYVNADEIHRAGDLEFSTNTQAPLFYIGVSGLKDRSLYGSLSEMRFWQTERSAAEIRRTLYMGLSGKEPGLAGCWQLVAKPVNGALVPNRADTTGRALNGKFQIDSTQTLKQTEDGTFLSVVAGVGGDKAVVGHGFLMSQYWNHIAVVFQSGTAVRLNPGPLDNQTSYDYVVCGNSQVFNLGDTASLEAHLLSDRFENRAGAIISRWGVEDEDGDDQRSYRLYLDDAGKLAMDLVLLVPTKQSDGSTKDVPQTFTVASSAVIAGDGEPHHVVGTYQTESQTRKDNVTQLRGKLTLYIDANVAGVAWTGWIDNAATLSIRAVQADVCIGMQAYTGLDTPMVALESQAYLCAVVTGVRVWSDALDQQRVAAIAGHRLQGDLTGLIAAWWFGEQEGMIAADSVGDNDGRLSSSDLWVLYRPLAETVIYANGYRIAMYQPATDEQKVGYESSSYAQFTPGAYVDGSTYKAGLVGELAELRLWKTARAPTQILNNRFRPLTGYEAGLIGYWPFNGDGNDDSGNGNNATLIGATPPTYVASTAPVANEMPAVRNLYSDHVTIYQEPLDGRPSVVEYGDTQQQSDGSLFAVSKRAYIYVNQRITVDSDFKVGDLDLVHIGQVQTEPTLLGYIEGAPPIPSENLSRPLYTSAIAYNGYFDASAISLNQASSVSYSFSTSDYSTTQMQIFRASVGFFGNWKVNTVEGSPFFSLSDNKFINKLKLGFKTQVDHSQADIKNNSIASGWTTTSLDSLSLRGNWEPKQSNPRNYLDPRIGRRFIPDNVGYALVESLVADLYSMQIRGTGQMIGKVVVPDPDIPPDKNIITFKIDPRYVKNGSLDGKVGMAEDPDTADRSYFKAKEAYRLKDQVEQQNSDIEAFYEQFDAGRLGRSKQLSLDEAAEKQFYDWRESIPRKNMFNGYVWTASGGLHKEEQQVIAERQSSFSGNYKLTWAGGLGFETEVALKVGVYGGVDLLFGHQTDVSVTRESVEGESFGMTAVVAPDAMLKAWNPDANNGSGEYGDEDCPGKVDAYRFMSFYLSPTSDNAETFLDTVVDPQWYKFSDDPNAIALRSGRIADNKVWRILHRVTYVSRVAPAFNDMPGQSVAQSSYRNVAVEDNALLVALVQVALNGKPWTPPNLGTAVKALLAPDSGSAMLSDSVSWWQTFLDSTRGSSPNPDAVALMGALRQDLLEFLIAGSQSGQLPPPTGQGG